MLGRQIAAAATTGGLLLAAILLTAAAGNRASDAVVALWAEQRAILEVSRVGNTLSARIVALADARYRDDEDGGAPGAPRLDDHNPDPALRHRPLVGLELLSAGRLCAHPP